jgi:hypothetical protein
MLSSECAGPYGPKRAKKAKRVDPFNDARIIAASRRDDVTTAAELAAAAGYELAQPVRCLSVGSRRAWPTATAAHHHQAARHGSRRASGRSRRTNRTFRAPSAEDQLGPPNVTV